MQFSGTINHNSPSSLLLNILCPPHWRSTQAHETVTINTQLKTSSTLTLISFTTTQISDARQHVPIDIKTTLHRSTTPWEGPRRPHCFSKPWSFSQYYKIQKMSENTQNTLPAVECTKRHVSYLQQSPPLDKSSLNFHGLKFVSFQWVALIILHQIMRQSLLT